MLEMSFYNGTLKVEELIEIIKNTNKPIVYTYGLKFRRPLTLEVPITKEQAIEYIKNDSRTDATEYFDRLDLNQYGSNDMY